MKGTRSTIYRLGDGTIVRCPVGRTDRRELLAGFKGSRQSHATGDSSTPTPGSPDHARAPARRRRCRSSGDRSRQIASSSCRGRGSGRLASRDLRPFDAANGGVDRRRYARPGAGRRPPPRALGRCTRKRHQAFHRVGSARQRVDEGADQQARPKRAEPSRGRLLVYELAVPGTADAPSKYSILPEVSWPERDTWLVDWVRQLLPGRLGGRSPPHLARASRGTA